MNRLLRKILVQLITCLLFFQYCMVYANNSTLDKNILADQQVFRRGNGDEIESLDPHKASSVPANNVLLDLYEGLMTYDQTGKLILGQAESYTISEDMKIYTFKLRENLKWSNGEALTASDFVAGMRRTVDPQVGSVYAEILKPIKNAEPITNGKLTPKALGVEAPDAKTLVITLEKPTPYFLELLTHATTLPIYRPNLKKYGNDFTLPGKHVTNGAFKLKEWVVHSHIELEKNPNYRDAEQVILDKVLFYPIQEQSVELKRFRANDLDYTAIIPDVQFDWIKANLKNELHISPQLATYYFGFNLTKPPFKDNKNLRKALSLAIDKKIIAEKVLRSGQIATDYLVPVNTNNYKNLIGSISPDLNNEDYKKNIELAKEYYAKAGYGANNPATVKILYNTQESHKSVSVAIAAMWKKALGVKTELVNQEWKVFLRTRLERKETEFFREAWVGDFNDPMTFLDLYTTNNPQNHSGYSNSEYDKLIEQACKEKDLTTRAAILKQAEEILLEDAPIVPLYTYVSRHLVKSHVGNFANDLLDRTYDRYIYIKKT
jgi:oligopeptide transport system substrate-binding protein